MKIINKYNIKTLLIISIVLILNIKANLEEEEEYVTFTTISEKKELEILKDTFNYTVKISNKETINKNIYFIFDNIFKMEESKKKKFENALEEYYYYNSSMGQCLLKKALKKIHKNEHEKYLSKVIKSKLTPNEIINKIFDYKEKIYYLKDEYNYFVSIIKDNIKQKTPKEQKIFIKTLEYNIKNTYSDPFKYFNEKLLYKMKKDDFELYDQENKKNILSILKEEESDKKFFYCIKDKKKKSFYIKTVRFDFIFKRILKMEKEKILTENEKKEQKEKLDTLIYLIF